MQFAGFLAITPASIGFFLIPVHMATKQPNPYAAATVPSGPSLPPSLPSPHHIILVNFAAWTLLLAVPVTLNVFAFVIPVESIRTLYWRFNYWEFLPYYFLTFSFVNVLLFRHLRWHRHFAIQVSAFIGAALGQIPFVFVMLITYRGPW